MKKQTAVEWFTENLKYFPHIKQSRLFKDLVNQAKAMEKEQIEDAWDDGIDSFSTRSAEQYYNETYGGDK